jgi:prepilin-type processing-associated H-X9-DG protein
MSKIFNVAYADGHEIVENFTFLGNKGLKNILGSNVVYVNGLSCSQ